jgi:hypothetical protein
MSVKRGDIVLVHVKFSSGSTGKVRESNRDFCNPQLSNANTWKLCSKQTFTAQSAV